MLNQMPALIAVREAAEREILSARPNAPVVHEQTRAVAHRRAYRLRAALATTLARVADVVAPIGWAPAPRAASSR